MSVTKIVPLFSAVRIRMVHLHFYYENPSICAQDTEILRYCGERYHAHAENYAEFTSHVVLYIRFRLFFVEALD